MVYYVLYKKVIIGPDRYLDIWPMWHMFIKLNNLTYDTLLSFWCYMNSMDVNRNSLCVCMYMFMWESALT